MTEKKKILIFSLAYHPFVGGAEVAIKEITDRLASAIGGPASGCDFQFEMITTNLDGKQKSEEQLGNVKVYRVGKGKIDKYLFPWLAYKKAKELHRQNNYSVIWAMMANQAGWAAMKFKRKYPRTQFLLTLQEGDSEWDIMIRTFLIRPIYKAIYRRADYIQAISSFLAKRARNLGAKSPIEVVPNGIDIKSEIRNSKFETNSNDQNIKLVITVSRLVKKNGVEDLIRAVQDVDGKLLILGDGELRNQLTNLVKELKLQDKVTFWGEVSNEQVYQYLSQADVFVRPSLSEGLGNAFLEAMSMNVPVIATEVGGIPDFIKDGETGWFCQVKDSKSITEKINYVLDEKNRLEVLRVIDNAKKLVDEKYDWDKITSQIRNIFYKLSGEIKFKKGKLISGIVYPEIMPIKKNETVLNIGCGDGVQAVIYGGSYSKMTGVDIQSERLEIAKKLMDFYNINNFEPVVANVEQIPLEEKYDKVMAIDIIEHVQNPEQVIYEARRLLQDNGQLLITFPAMHDKWESLFKFAGRNILGRPGKTIKSDGWNPDEHQRDYSVSKWIDLVESGGFILQKSQATTIFPPLHYLGLPRFWFSWGWLHIIDRFFCRLPGVKNCGQSLVCIFKKKK